MKIEQTERSETSAYKFQTPGNHPKESIQHSVHGESLKSRIKDALRVNLRKFIIVPRCIFRIRKVSDKYCTEIRALIL